MMDIQTKKGCFFKDKSTNWNDLKEMFPWEGGTFLSMHVKNFTSVILTKKCDWYCKQGIVWLASKVTVEPVGFLWNVLLYRVIFSMQWRKKHSRRLCLNFHKSNFYWGRLPYLSCQLHWETSILLSSFHPKLRTGKTPTPSILFTCAVAGEPFPRDREAHCAPRCVERWLLSMERTQRVFWELTPEFLNLGITDIRVRAFLFFFFGLFLFLFLPMLCIAGCLSARLASAN